jgi:ATP-dependent DNA helicase RecG
MSTRDSVRRTRAEERPAPPAPRRGARDVPVTELAGVGPARAGKLAALGVASVHDLLCTLPRKLEIAPAPVSIAEARARSGADVRIRGVVAKSRFSRFGRRSLVRVTVEDPTGAIDVLFFNQPWLRERFVKGVAVELIGRRVEASGAALAASKLGTDSSPLLPEGSLEPVYPATEGVTQEFLRALIRGALEKHGASLEERLGSDALSSRGLPPLDEAVREVHAPRSREGFEAARRRIALEPLLALQASFAARRAARARGRAVVMQVDDAAHRELLSRFPFELTEGQRRVAGELRRDLARRAPMRRLLQGDVGSGKTVLGAYACMLACAAGAQSAFLAPTELLAEQHARGLEPLLARAGLRTALLVGSLAPAARRTVLARLAEGTIDVVFGTHALLGESVRFARLALAVVDEQHRFGVAQREALFDKGRDVHGLLMTATPIPRSLALTVYGDLDVSVLREKPPGRGRVATRWIRDRRELAPRISERLELGERVYWVVPRIEGEEGGDDESLASDGAGAEQRFERMRGKSWARFGVELVHGRMPAARRSAALERFRSGAARILVATTVIEVGVDVPEATVMVVESAERLGLAQLHQLRGRVGRGARESACFLLGSVAAAERLELLERSDDGFAIAEEDLRQRGMGDLLGLRQAGENREGLESPESDLELVLLARELLAARPELAKAYARGRARS